MTNQEAKLKIISNTYLNLFTDSGDDLKSAQERLENIIIWIDKHGWFSGELYNIPIEKLDLSGYECRPISLRGFDDNNKWIRIEPDGSNLPKDKTISYKMFVEGLDDVFEGFYDDCWCYKSDGSIHELKGVTHYKISEKDKKPIW